MQRGLLFCTMVVIVFILSCSDTLSQWQPDGDLEFDTTGESGDRDLDLGENEIDDDHLGDKDKDEFVPWQQIDGDIEPFEIGEAVVTGGDHDFSISDGDDDSDSDYDEDCDYDYERYDCQPALQPRALYWINPFPTFGQGNPVGIYSGRMILQTPHLPVFWPGMIIPADGENYFGPERYATFSIEVWDTLFLGNSSGGFWQANASHEWQTVMEMTGGGPLSIAYEDATERVVALGYCSVFVMEKEGYHRLFHFYDRVLSSNSNMIASVCSFDGVNTKLYGEIVSYGEHIYLYDQANSYTEDESGNLLTDKSWNVLFRLENNRFTKVCEFPERRQANTFPNYSISRPAEYNDLLILPGVPGEIWAFDGNSCFKWYEDERLEVPILNSQTLNNSLYLSSATTVYRYKGGKLFEEFNTTSENNLWAKYELNLMKANPGYGQLFVGGRRYGGPMTQSILYVRQRNGVWKSLHNNLWEGRQEKAMPVLTSGTFAPNGKGFILGDSTIANIEREAEPMMTPPVHYNGSEWSLWGQIPIDAVDAYTPDGETLFVLSASAVKFASKPDDYLTLQVPPTDTDRFNRFVKTTDGLTIIGDDGLICLPDHENSWTCEHSTPSHDWVEGIWYDQYLWVTSGYDLYRYGAGSLEYIPCPDLSADYDRGNHEFFCGPHPYPDRCTFVFQPNHLAVSDGRLFLGRNDGIWVRQDGFWARIAPSVGDTYVNHFHTVDLAPCGNGICRISTNSLSDGTSRLDIITVKAEEDSFAYATRPLDYGTDQFMPFTAVRQSESRTIIIGRQGMMMEWAEAPSNPLATAIEYCPSYPSNTFDLDEYYGSCTSSFENEIPRCQSGVCQISAGDYCIGATRKMDEMRLAKASDLPSQSVQLNAFYIDEMPISTQAFAEFLVQFPYVNQFEYLSISQPEPGRSIEWNGDQMVVVKPEAPMLFANFQGAELFCEQVGKRLCTAAEWEVACRGHDDDPFPGGWQHWFDLSPQPSMDDFIPSESDFGVMDMVHYLEFTTDLFYHDSLRKEPPTDPAPNSPILKGGFQDGTCSTRRGYVNPPSGTAVAFRCCRDH